MTHQYFTKFRPAFYGTCPANFRFVASGDQDPLPNRPELPRSDKPFGVIEYDRELTAEEVETYQLGVIAAGAAP